MKNLQKYRKIKQTIEAIKRDEYPVQRVKSLHSQVHDAGGITDILTTCKNAKKELLDDKKKLEMPENKKNVEEIIEKDLQTFLELPEQLTQHQNLMQKDIAYRLSELEGMVFEIASSDEQDKKNAIETLLSEEKENFMKALDEIGHGNKKLSQEEKTSYSNQYVAGIEAIKNTYLEYSETDPNLKNQHLMKLEEKQEALLKQAAEARTTYEAIQITFLKEHDLSQKPNQINQEIHELDQMVRELNTSTKNLLDKKMAEISEQDQYLKAIQEHVDNFSAHATALRLRNNEPSNLLDQSTKPSRYSVAADKIDRIADTLNQDLENLQNLSLSVRDRKTKINNFREKTEKTIEDNASILETHRDLNKILSKLVTLLNKICQKISGSHFSIFNTTSGNLLREIGKTTEQQESPRPKL